MNTPCRWLLAAITSCLLAACGGGAGDSPSGTGANAPTSPTSPTVPTSPTGPTPATTVSIAGSVVAADSDAPLAAVRLSVAGKEATSASDGRFALADIAPAGRIVVKAEAAGYTDAFAVLNLAAGDAGSARLRLFAAAPAQTIDSAQPATVTAPNSTARVQLPAAGLVDAATGAPVSGNVRVSVTAIDPAREPAQMPGGYTAVASSGSVQSIESFGAVKVDLRDAAGRRLNLAAGKQATIRIPLATRSANPPASVPLFYFDEASGHWVQQGSAALAGSGADRWYEGSVSHFTFWNADQVTETVIVDGCLTDRNGAALPRLPVASEGIDYSGTADAQTDAQGRFSVAVRKSSKAAVYATSASRQRFSNVVTVDAGIARVTLGTCLMIDTGPGVDPLMPPVIVKQPLPVTAAVGEYALFDVTAIGSRPLAYQWSCNGADMPGATGTSLAVYPVQPADDGKQCKVVVRNAAGSATSNAAALTVTGTVLPPVVVRGPLDAALLVGQTATFSVQVSGSGPYGYQWQRNGVDIAGATAPLYTTPAAVLADDGARFTAVVRNAGGAVTSPFATLTVSAAPGAPLITRQPSNQVLTSGEEATFRVEAAATGAMSFQWQRNGADIAGATAKSLTVTATAGNDGASYSARVTASGGSAVSEPALLVVRAGDPAARARLTRMGELPMQLSQASATALMLADETNFQVRSPLCDAGSATLTLDGAGTTAGQVLPSGNHSAVATLAACRLATGAVASGRSAVDYSYASADRLQGRYTATASNLRYTQQAGLDNDSDVVVNGSIATVVDGVRSGSVDTIAMTYTPAAGATLASQAGGATASFAGGSFATRMVIRGRGTAAEQATLVRVEYRALRIAVAGVTYTLDGHYELRFDTTAFFIVGTGVVNVSADGAVVGRIIGSESGVVADVRGSVPQALLQAVQAAGKRVN